MNLAMLSIKRPIFISCIVAIMVILGYVTMKKLPVDLFPDVTFPIVVVTNVYPGAGPSEVETLLTKPIEDELSTISGLKRITSTSQEGFSQVVAEFNLETDIKYAEQQVRDKVSSAKTKLPEDAEEPLIQRIDPSNSPVIRLAILSDLPDAKLYDLAEDQIKTRVQQVKDVGLVEITGGRKREIHVILDRNKLKAREISASAVVGQMAASGENIPSGKVDESQAETVFKSVGEFKSLNDIANTVVSFFSNESAVRVKDVGQVKEALQDEKRRALVNGKKALFIDVYKQSGSNTIRVVRGVKDLIPKIEENLKSLNVGNAEIKIIQDGSREIDANIFDVNETILIGIILTIFVVFLFLGSAKSTLITALALPNSILGAFVLMGLAGFSINIVTLTALVLSVGLLVDDAIVVRENIFRRIEGGEEPFRASLFGTLEVQLAVIATSLVVIAVFAPVAFMGGIIGQFLKQFGLTVCFAMIISLFDALTVAPMLSAYFASGHDEHRKPNLFQRLTGPSLRAFDRFQTRLENRYERILKWVVRHPVSVLGMAVAIFLVLMSSVAFLPGQFLPAQDSGEFVVDLELKPGTNLQTMSEFTGQVDVILRSNSEVELTGVTVGGRNSEANKANIFIKLVEPKLRPKVDTTALKEKVREQLKDLSQKGKILVKDYDPTGGGTRPFAMVLTSNNPEVLETYARTVIEALSRDPRLKEVDSTLQPGKPEFHFKVDPLRAQSFGVNTKVVGAELRTQVEGVTPAKFRENGEEYEIRVRLQEDQRNLREAYNQTFVPNVNQRLVMLNQIASAQDVMGPSNINRRDRSKSVEITADPAAGADLSGVMAEVSQRVKSGDLKLPAGVSFAYFGDSENFQELGDSILIALGFAVLFIFMVLASLYESFITPLTIMLALPLALGGAFAGLLIANESINLFAFLGIFMLLGMAAKNSILLVDFARDAMLKGQERTAAMVLAGKTRLRPILMTSFALVAGTLPLAIGLNEASKQRTSMGVAVIGGTVTSTLLTLIVIPAAFIFLDRFRAWVSAKFGSDKKEILAEKLTMTES